MNKCFDSGTPMYLIFVIYTGDIKNAPWWWDYIEGLFVNIVVTPDVDKSRKKFDEFIDKNTNLSSTDFLTIRCLFTDDLSWHISDVKQFLIGHNRYKPVWKVYADKTALVYGTVDAVERFCSNTGVETIKYELATKEEVLKVIESDDLIYLC